MDGVSYTWFKAFGGTIPGSPEIKLTPCYRLSRCERRGYLQVPGAAGALTRVNYSICANRNKVSDPLKNYRRNPEYKPCIKSRALSYPLTTRPTVAHKRKLVHKGLWEAEVPGTCKPWERGGLRRKEMYWVYFVQPDNRPVCKVGITRKHPAERLAGLQTGSPDKLKVIGAFAFEFEDEARYVETEYHLRWRNGFRMNGEWINLNARTLLTCFADVCKNNEDGEPIAQRCYPLKFYGRGVKKNAGA